MMIQSCVARYDIPWRLLARNAGRIGKYRLISRQCEEGYHFDCATPTLQETPDGEWFCHECELEGTGGLHEPFRPSTTWNQAKKPGGKTQDEVDKSARSKSSRRSLAEDDMRSTASQSKRISWTDSTNVLVLMVLKVQAREPKLDNNSSRDDAEIADDDNYVPDHFVV